MVHKNVRFGKVENVCLAEFGKGSVILNHTTPIDGDDGTLCVLIKTATQSGVANQLVPEGHPDYVSHDRKDYNSDEFEPEMVLMFNNIEGVEALKGNLEDIIKLFRSKLG
ncbi:hypothetical protein ACFSQ3_00140 [Sphingobacterium corticis]|uniref:Uncharacterized protein n=1 Tax=Sphingobacterium corticis TaxID=1812823 RepID=A0ABW5NEE5_9SPHI